MAPKLLICDDDELLCKFYSRVLKAQGYEVLTGANGEEGLNIIKENPDLSIAIIDLLMPIKTGWELIEDIKSDPELSDIPLITITGLATSPEEYEKVKSNCCAVLNKGEFELSNFIKTIKEFSR